MAAVQAGGVSCKQFASFWIRKAEHLDETIIRDITPTSGWIGHVSTGVFPAYDGVEHTFDRINRVMPDLSGCWVDRTVTACIGSPCDPDEKEIGFGSTRDSYKLQKRSYRTQLFCFDDLMSADRAREQATGIVDNLKTATNIIVSDRMKVEALRISGTKILAGAGMENFTYTWNADCTEMTVSGLPTSKVTIQMLMRQVEPLKLNGYFGANPGLSNMVEYVTDLTSGYSLVQGNAALTNLFRFEDFMEGGKLYKYGIVAGIGNFGFRYDDMPLRFQDIGGGVLQRVFPYVNVAATLGIKGEVNQAYVNAEYQIDFIWNRMAMQNLVRQSSPVHPLMPFADRNFGGRWQFVQHDLGADSSGCVINNERRNKGRFIADFEMATKALRPEWAVAILHKREIACVVDVAPCSDLSDYVAQDYNSANDPCPNPTLTFDFAGVTEPFTISADDESITCNGVPVAHDASGSLADLDAVVVWLNANVGTLGTWAHPADTDTITLAGSTCNTVNLDLVGS